MKIKMLSTQQDTATGTTFIAGDEYDVSPDEGKAFVEKGWAMEVAPNSTPVAAEVPPAPKPLAPPAPPLERVHPDTSKPLSTVEAKTISDDEAIRAGYPAKQVDAPAVFPPKNVIFNIPKRPTGVGPAHVGGMQVATSRPQTAFVKHHESAIEILQFLGQPTDGSVLLMKPGNVVPFALEDYPYAELKDGDLLDVVNYIRPISQPSSTAVLTPSGHVSV